MKHLIKTIACVGVLVFFIGCGKSREEHAKDIVAKATYFSENISKAIPEAFRTEAIEVLKVFSVDQAEALQYIGNFSSHIQTNINTLERIAVKHCGAHDLQAINNIMDQVNAWVGEFTSLMPKIWSLSEDSGLKHNLMNLIVNTMGNEPDLVSRLKAALSAPNGSVENLITADETEKIKKAYENFSAINKAKIEKFMQDVNILLLPFLSENSNHIQNIEAQFYKVSPGCLSGVLQELVPFASQRVGL